MYKNSFAHWSVLTLVSVCTNVIVFLACVDVCSTFNKVTVTVIYLLKATRVHGKVIEFKTNEHFTRMS